jgi:transcriptional regulator with GAF, ATPase, and Fis domain
MSSAESILQTYLGLLPASQEGGILRLLVELGIQVVGADEGSLLVLDEKSRSLLFAMTVGDRVSEKTLMGQRVPLGKGITGLAAATHEVQIGAPTYKDIRQTRRRGGPAGAPEAVIAAPMLIGDTLIGVITCVSFRKGKRFGADDARLYAGLASIAGVVVDQCRRLSAAGAGRGARAPLKALGEIGAIEREIAGSIARLSRTRPEALRCVAQILRSVERITLSSGGG